jgi:hypothetical protein
LEQYLGDLNVSVGDELRIREDLMIEIRFEASRRV